jgi:D-alanine-D-alanine ligase
VTDKARIAVIMGGQSGEHDVSIKSGNGVLANLMPEKYRGTPVVIQRDGSWAIDNQPALPMLNALAQLQGNVDVAFLALHGPNGEDGTIQALFHLMNIPYTGSDYYASSLAMNKPRAKDVFRGAGLDVARHVSVYAHRQVGLWHDRDGVTIETAPVAQQIVGTLGCPVVAKTTKLGSSVGVGIAQSAEELIELLTDFARFGGEVMVEEFIEGTEVTAPVIDDPETGQPQALPLIEIRPKVSGWFDFRAKYEIGGADEICPAPIPVALFRKCQNIGLVAHRILGCTGMSRTDIIITGDDRCYVIETNTIPGFTETSLLPQAAAEAGTTYPQLVDLLIRNALR